MNAKRSGNIWSVVPVSAMASFCLWWRGFTEDGMACNEIASSMALTAFGRFNVPLLDELAVGTALMLLILRLRQARGLMQGEDASVFVLGS